MSDYIPDGLLADTSLVQPGTPDRLAKIYEHAAELARTEQQIARIEAELQRLKDDRKELAHRTLPRLFDEINVDSLGVPGYNADITLETKIHAAIKSDWDEITQEAGFAEIERLNGEDLIKISVAVEFTRGEFALAADFVRMIRGVNWLGGRQVTVRKGVHWATLTKWVEGLLAKRVPVDLEKIGGTAFRFCTIRRRPD